MHARNLLARFVLALLIWSDISSVFAAPPTPPSGFLAGGQFAQYFKNIVEGGLGVGTCPVGQSVIGFNTGASSIYGMPVCQAIASSQWTTNGANIYYSVGNVGIGTSSPGGKLSIGGGETGDESRLTFQASDFSNRFTIETDLDGNTGNDLLGFRSTALDNILVLKGNGNIGIGTTSPTAKLEVNGDFKANNVVYGDNATKTTLLTDFNSTIPSGFYNAYNVNGQPYAGSWWHLITNRHYNEGNQYEFQLTSDFWQGGRASYLRTIEGGVVQPWRQLITAESNGNVGIGTSLPISPLQINNGVSMTAGYKRILTLHSDHPTMQFKGISDTNHSAFIGYDAQNASEGLRFWVAGTTDDVGNAINAMNIHKSGNVGIGTASPGQKLSVVGTIESTTGGFKFPDGTTQTTASVGGSWYDGWVTSPGYNANTIGASKSGFSYSNNAAHTGPLVHFDAGGYGLQLSADYSGGGEGMSFRTRNGDSATWNGWNRLITTENGMDLTSTQTPTGVKYFQSNKGASSYLGANNTYSLEAYSSDGGAAAMSFHRGGAYAINMGLDPDNVFRIGGWSAGSNRLQLDMAGNLYSASSMRSSVFYDQDNTAYYTDPASTSVLNNLRFNGIDCISGNCPSNGVVRLTPNLHLNAGAGYAVILNWDNGTTGGSQALRIGNGAGSDVFYVLANGSTYAYNYYYLSDRSLKKDIVPVTGALDKIKKIQGVNFLWKKDDAKGLGFIAQDVEKVFPEVVSTDKNTGLKSVQYGNLISPAIESIKELADKSDAHEKEIQELKKQIAELKEIISHK